MMEWMEGGMIQKSEHIYARLVQRPRKKRKKKKEKSKRHPPKNIDPPECC